jgi:hypothetical protein
LEAHWIKLFVRIGGKWLYLFRAVESVGQTLDFYLSETRDREAAELFLKRALANTDNRAQGCWRGTDYAATRLPSANCKKKSGTPPLPSAPAALL